MGNSMGGGFPDQAGGFDNRAGYDQRNQAPQGGQPVFTCCKLRGLPFSATHQDIFHFFSGLNVIGTLFVRDSTGRPTGEAFCEFQTPYEVTLAAQRHRQHMGSRYVEVFPCSKDEVLGYYNSASGDARAPQQGQQPGAAHAPQAMQPAQHQANGNPSGTPNGAYAAAGGFAAAGYGNQAAPNAAPQQHMNPQQGYTDPYVNAASPQAQGGSGAYGYYAAQAQGNYADNMARSAGYPQNGY
uniref:RRM domain-containing protein n=1 Tax=Phaeomonas parva TaxID=124430 RepID=A0A7S1UFS5_9STRA